VDLRIASSRLRDMASETLSQRVQRTAVLFGGLAAATVPTDPRASGNERRELGIEARRAADLLLKGGREVGGWSISHARGVSVAVSTLLPRRTAVDIELVLPARPRIASRILTARELEHMGDLVPWIGLLTRFCAKEAAYKVQTPERQADLRFRSMEVELSPCDGTWIARHCTDGSALAIGAVSVNSLVVVALAEQG
jgi:hypothetical protein